MQLPSALTQAQQVAAYLVSSDQRSDCVAKVWRLGRIALSRPWWRFAWGDGVSGCADTQCCINRCSPIRRQLSWHQGLALVRSILMLQDAEAIL